MRGHILKCVGSNDCVGLRLREGRLYPLKGQGETLVTLISMGGGRHAERSSDCLIFLSATGSEAVGSVVGGEIIKQLSRRQMCNPARSP